MGITQQRQPAFINLRDFNPYGDGVHDDYQAFANANAASVVGSKIIIPPPPVPGSSYMVSQTIPLLPGRCYEGTAYGAVSIKQMPGVNLTAVMASQGYLNNSVYVDTEVELRNLFVDGNWGSNSAGHGIVLMNSFALVRQIWCNNIPGTGLILSDRSIANINTTVAASQSSGVQSPAPASMTGIVTGMSLQIANSDGSNREAVTVTSVTSTTFTAAFANAHTANFTVSSILMNSSIENRILECKIANVTQYGIWARDNSINSGRVTDVHVLNNVLSNCGANGGSPVATVQCERSAGFFIHRNHVYSCQGSGFNIQNAWSTFVTENEVDGYGQNTTATGQYWQGINVVCIGPRASVVSDNIVSTSEPNSSTIYQHVNVTGGGTTTTRAIVDGNDVYGGGGDSVHSIGYVYQSNATQVGSGQSFSIVPNSNKADNVGKQTYVDSNATTVLAPTEIVGDVQFDRHVTVSNSIDPAPTLAALAAAGTGAPTPTFSSLGGADVRGKVQMGSGTSPASGNQASVTFGKAYASIPNVLVSAMNAATQALGPYVDTSTQSLTGFNIAFANAPAASQAVGTYQLCFLVIG